MKKMLFGSLKTTIFLCLVLIIQPSVYGQSDCILDDASDGFGVWTQQATTTNSSEAGQLIGSSDLGTSWALYANSGQTSEIFRDLSNPVEIGGTISIQMDNGDINQEGGVVGVSFRNSSFENLAEVYFAGGQANYTVNASGGPIDAGIGFTGSGLLIHLKLLTTGQFEVTLSYLSNAAVSQTLSGTLNSPAGGQSLENIRLFNFNAGGGNDQFFNNLEVCSPPDCVPGFYNLNDVCTICPAGSYCPGDGNAYPCEPGSFAAGEGQVDCALCPMGQFSGTSGATECTDCPAGKFSDEVGAASCADCPVGTSQSNTGSTFCFPCAEGTFSNTAGSEVCTACDEGFDSNTGAAECFDCQLDFVNLQFPGGATICEGSSFTAFGQVFEAGLTDVLGDQVLEIEAQYGITASTDPNPNNWPEDSWSPATFNSSSPNGDFSNDEYKFDLLNAQPGSYYYTFRYRRVGCDNWIIGGYPSGEWDGTTNNAGQLTVLEEIDLDGDGFSAIGSPCGTANDCDDSNENINPGQTEILFNGIDDDCNSATADFNSGIFESFVVVDGTFYNLMSSSGNPDFDGNDLGIVSCDGLILNGGENKVFKCNNGDILNGSLLYRVYAINSASGSFNSVDFSFIENFNITAECRDQIWQQTGASVDLSAGLPPGSYAIEVYTTADYTFTGGSGTHFSNNGGNNYTATFTIADSDSDGTSDCEDACPTDPDKITEGICGCGIADSDTDMDGVEDCNDGCPNDPLLVTPPTWYIDADGDGFGSSADAINSCQQPAGYVADDTDCDDSNEFINPEADEVCDGVDNNCNGLTDVSDPDYLDDIAPVISCPSEQTQFADNNCEAVLADYTNLATASDNCSGAVSIIQSPAAGTPVSLGTVTVTLTASDGLNSTDCSFDVNVVDNSPPVITCPADVVVNNDPGICGAIVSFDEITAIDNCDDLSITQVGGPSSGSIFPIGTTSVSYIVQDGAGFEAACSFDVTVAYDPLVSIDSPQDPQENENGILVSDGVVTVYYSQSSSFYSSLGVTDFAELNSTLTPECSNGETNIDYQWFYFSLAEDADGIPDPFDPYVWTSVSGATGSSYTVNASTSIDFHRAYLVAISNDNGTYDVASNYIEVISIDTRCKNPNKVKICMVPNGNPDNSHEICININAVDAILENSPGSFLGPCEPVFKTSDDRLAEVDIFPNPTSSFLTIQYTPFVNQDARLEIHDSRGGLIKEISIAPTQAKSLNEVSLDMSEFANGIYLVRVIDKQGIQTRRVVLSK